MKAKLGYEQLAFVIYFGSTKKSANDQAGGKATSASLVIAWHKYVQSLMLPSSPENFNEIFAHFCCCCCLLKIALLTLRAIGFQKADRQ